MKTYLLPPPPDDLSEWERRLWYMNWFFYLTHPELYQQHRKEQTS